MFLNFSVFWGEKLIHVHVFKFSEDFYFPFTKYMIDFLNSYLSIDIRIQNFFSLFTFLST